MPSQTFRIGDLAERTAVTPDTLRYYERLGLLNRPPRTDGGFRVYDERARARVLLIKRAQRVGLTLDEIKRLVTFDGRGLERCRRVHGLIQTKVSKLDEQMADLRALRRTLISSLKQCEDTIRSHGVECPLVEDDGSSKTTPTPRTRRGESR